MNTRISQKARRTVLRLATGVAPRRDDFDVSKAGVVKRLLIDVRELTPALSARAAEMEASRRIPHDVVKLLKAIGAFRLFVPQSHGGLELDLPGGLSIITALARVDGSVGWTVMIGNGGPLFAALLPREIYDRVYRGGP